MTIPRILHQIWFQGEAQVPAGYRDRARELRDMNPDWTYRLWDDRMLQEECRQLGPQVLAKYRGFQYMHQKIDFGRYVVLFNHGGMSVDMDVKALRPIDSVPGLADRSLIVCRAPLNALELLVFSMGHFRVLINNAMILAEPRCPYLERLIDDVVAADTWGWGPMYRIQWTTGPFAFTRSLNRSAEDLGGGGLSVLESKYFEPCSSHGPSCEVNAAAILDHQHAVSWVGGGWVNIAGAYFAVKPHLLPAVLTLLLVWLVCGRRR